MTVLGAMDTLLFRGKARPKAPSRTRAGIRGSAGTVWTPPARPSRSTKPESPFDVVITDLAPDRSVDPAAGPALAAATTGTRGQAGLLVV